MKQVHEPPMAAIVETNDGSKITKWTTFCNDTTLHGIKYTVGPERNKTRRVVWVLLMMVMFAGCGFVITRQIFRYFEYDTSTRITVKNDKFLDFPSVTICNLNMARKSVIMKYPLMDDFMQSTSFVTSLPRRRALKDPALISAMTNINLYDFYKEAAHTKEKMILKCTFDHRICNDMITITPTLSGFCYTFNSQEVIDQRGSSLVAKQTGRDHGLVLTADIQHSEYYYSGLYPSAGLSVQVHTPSAEPRMAEYSFIVSPGTDTNVGITKTVRIGLPEPYQGSWCSLDEPKLTLYDHYDYGSCLSNCFSDSIADYCQCHLTLRKVRGGLRNCNMAEIITCGLPAIVVYYANASREESCKCVHQCNETLYHTRLSTAYFPADHIFDEFQQSVPGITLDYVRHNFLSLAIYFEDLSYEIVEQVPSYSEQQFLADLGGQLGLFLGASIITCAEFVDFVINLAIKKWFRDRILSVKSSKVANESGTLNR